MGVVMRVRVNFLLVLLLTAGACDDDPDAVPPPPPIYAADGVSIRFMADGLGNPGPAILFVHGWSNNRSFAQPRFDRFAADHPVVALDVPGFGESGSSREEWDIPTLADDVRAVVHNLGLERVVLVGHSMGGAISISAAALMPERVVGIVTVDWLQDPHQDYDEAFFRDYRSNYLSGFRDPEWVRSVAFSADSPDENVQRYISNMPYEVPDHWWAILRAAFQWASDELVPTLEEIQVPVLAINTDAVPTNVEGYRELVPTFDARIMEGRGHIGILWEQEAEFDSHLTDFLASLNDR